MKPDALLLLWRWWCAALLALLLSCGPEAPAGEGHAESPAALIVGAGEGESSASKIGIGQAPVDLVLGSTVSIAPGLAPEAAYAGRLQERWQERGATIRVLNASIAGEPLGGALERLPALLEHPLRRAILELGQADEAVGTPLPLFEKNARQLLRAIRTRYPEAEVLLLCSASGPAYRKALRAAAEEVPGAPFIDLPSALGGPPRPEDAAWQERLAAAVWSSVGE